MDKKIKDKLIKATHFMKPEKRNQLLIVIAVVILSLLLLMAMFRPRGNRGLGRNQMQAFDQQGMGQYYSQTAQGFPPSQPVDTFQGNAPNANMPPANINGPTQVAMPCFGGGGGYSQIAYRPGCATPQNYNAMTIPGQQVALTNTIPPPTIFRDAILPHEFRGVCSNCHKILNTQNQTGIR